MLSKHWYPFMVALAMLIYHHSEGQDFALSMAQNQNDYVNLPLENSSITDDSTAFTAECWFTIYNVNSTSSLRRLMLLEGDSTLIEVGVALGGQLVYKIDAIGGEIPLTTLTTIAPNVWRHFAMVKNNDQIDFYVDCSLVGSSSSLAGLDFNIEDLYLGQRPNGNLDEDWYGLVDEFRLWEKARTPSEICDQQFCPLSCEEPGLLAYWDFNNPAAIPGGDNTQLTQVLDCTPNANHGIPVNLLQTGLLSNWVNSSVPLVHPALSDLTVDIRDYPDRNNLLTGICNGDPAHFCLEDNGQSPGPFSNVEVQWQYSDDGGNNWPDVNTPSFMGFCFPVLPGELTLPCNSSTDGFVDRKYRAAFTVTGSEGQECYYNSPPYDLQVCCPISPATVEVMPAGPFCEGEQADFQVCLHSPDPFVDSPGANTTIDWSFIDPVLGPTPIPSAANQTCLDYTNWTATLSGTGVLTTYCFEAVVSNCQGKQSTFNYCFEVNPQPVCGTIAGYPLDAPQNLDLISTDSLIYEICPGDDAILAIVEPFQFCTPHWQYTFTDPSEAADSNWVEIGFSNSEQNTNILPSHLWPASADRIYYRIKCVPSTIGCDPCYSDWIEIRLRQPPLATSILGPTQACAEAFPIQLSVDNPQPGITYTWLYEGLPYAIGSSAVAIVGGCYWLEADNGCEIVEGPPLCITRCTTIPLLSCPLPPNGCAVPGQPITLTACFSYNTCSGNSGLLYEWFIDDVSQGPAGSVCNLTHTPALLGTKYGVIITDTITGCTALAEQVIVPCDVNLLTPKK